MSHYRYDQIIGDISVVSHERDGRVTHLMVTLDEVARVVLVSEDVFLDLVQRANPFVEVVVVRDSAGERL